MSSGCFFLFKSRKKKRRFSFKKKKKKKCRISLRQIQNVAKVFKRSDQKSDFVEALQPNFLLWSWLLFRVFLKFNKHTRLRGAYEKVVGYSFVAVLFQFAAYPPVFACVRPACALEFKFFVFHTETNGDNYTKFLLLMNCARGTYDIQDKARTSYAASFLCSRFKMIAGRCAVETNAAAVFAVSILRIFAINQKRAAFVVQIFCVPFSPPTFSARPLRF